MIGEADREIRLRTFEWLTRQHEEHGETISRTALETFTIDGHRIPLVGPSGIWKPAVCELPVSITTTVGGPYDDSFDRQSGTLRYAYRGTDAGHRDNRGLRRAMVERVPIVYFHGEATSRPTPCSSSRTIRSGCSSRCRSMTSSSSRTSLWGWG